MRSGSRHHERLSTRRNRLLNETRARSVRQHDIRRKQIGAFGLKESCRFRNTSNAGCPMAGLLKHSDELVAKFRLAINNEDAPYKAYSRRNRPVPRLASAPGTTIYCAPAVSSRRPKNKFPRSRTLLVGSSPHDLIARGDTIEVFGRPVWASRSFGPSLRPFSAA
jgi:hypothetical protein